MMHHLVIWRHGRTQWNLDRRFQGHTDIALDGEGVRQAERAAPALAALQPAAIVSSDLQRATGTAAPLARATGHRVVTDPELREAYAGSWEGLTPEQISAADPDRFHRWRRDAGVRPGGGETAEEVGRRMTDAVNRHLRQRDQGERLVVVTHGGSARALIGSLLGWPVATWRRMAVMGNCAWAELEAEAPGTWRLVAYNRYVA